MELSKGDFAAHIKVSPGRISQYLASGIIDGEAISGKGRTARIVVEKAIEQIRQRRHVGQGIGLNGMTTDLSSTPPATVSPGATEPLVKVDPATEILVERLEGERRKNRMARIDEAKALGALVPAEDMQREIGKALQAQLNVFTGMAPDIANAIAAKFELPQRDVLHLVRQVMNEKRGTAAQQVRASAEPMPEIVEAELAA